jgi:hypothetical protein
LTAYFAADAKEVKNIAAVANNTVDAVNKINLEGTSSDTQMLSKTTTPETAQPKA